MWPVLPAALTSGQTGRRGNPARVCRTQRATFFFFCFSRANGRLVGFHNPSDISVLTKLPRRALSPSAATALKGSRRGGGPRLTDSVTCFKGPYPYLSLLLSFAGDEHRPQTPLPIFSLSLFIFFLTTYPTVTSRGCCLPRRPRKDSVTFIPSSILRGAPIKPFRRGGSVRMLPPPPERRAAPAGK